MKNLFKNLLLFFLICLAAFICPAQRKAKKPVLPRVGIIKDVGQVMNSLTGDCMDFYLFQSKKLEETGDYIFIGSYDGISAVMNLDGRDTQLDLVQETHRYLRDGQAWMRFDYRTGRRTSVTMIFHPPVENEIPFRTTVIVRSGKAKRTFRAFGYPQCDF